MCFCAFNPVAPHLTAVRKSLPFLPPLSSTYFILHCQKRDQAGIPLQHAYLTVLLFSLTAISVAVQSLTCLLILLVWLSMNWKKGTILRTSRRKHAGPFLCENQVGRLNKTEEKSGRLVFTMPLTGTEWALPITHSSPHLCRCWPAASRHALPPALVNDLAKVTAPLKQLQGWGFSSVVLPPVSQAQGPEFNLQYKKKNKWNSPDPCSK